MSINFAFLLTCLLAEFGLKKVVQTWNSHSIPGIHLFHQEKKCSIFWKIESKWKDSFFKGSLGEVSDQRSVLAEKKDFVKKGTEVHFSIFIENRNWDLKFVFQFNNENEKRKKSKLYFILKQKSNIPFDPWIRAPKVTFNFQFKIEMEKDIFANFNFYFKIKN